MRKLGCSMRAEKNFDKDVSEATAHVWARPKLDLRDIGIVS